MSAANDLINRFEEECGCRIDDNEGDNLAMAGLFGAMARMLGQTPSSYKERDDVVAGLLIRHQMTPEYQERKEAEHLMAEMLANGLSPDDLKSLMG